MQPTSHELHPAINENKNLSTYSQVLASWNMKSVLDKNAKSLRKLSYTLPLFLTRWKDKWG